MLVSDRDTYDWHILVIDDRDEVAIFDMLAQPHSFESLARFAEESLAGTVDLGGLLARWQEHGIVFTDGGQFIHVAAEARNQELTRVSPRAMSARSIEARRLPDEPAGGVRGGSN